jgi:hypothetical protein
MWSDFLKNTVLKPALQRLGTIGATALVFGGDWLCKHWDACGLVTQDGATLVATYLCAVALLAFDLAVIHLGRKAGK